MMDVRRKTAAKGGAARKSENNPLERATTRPLGSDSHSHPHSMDPTSTSEEIIDTNAIKEAEEWLQLLAWLHAYVE